MTFLDKTAASRLQYNCAKSDGQAPPFSPEFPSQTGKKPRQRGRFLQTAPTGYLRDDLSFRLIGLLFCAQHHHCSAFCRLPSRHVLVPNRQQISAPFPSVNNLDFRNRGGMSSHFLLLNCGAPPKTGIRHEFSPRPVYFGRRRATATRLPSRAVHNQILCCLKVRAHPLLAPSGPYHQEKPPTPPPIRKVAIWLPCSLS